jgi:APA family basic amino acid/polyamine antiporter
MGSPDRQITKSPNHQIAQFPDRHPLDRLERRLSFTDATMLVVASVIGVGIFLTPGRVAEILPHPALILAVWLFGGALSLAGALANAELGAMYPHAGGNYVYAREAFHPAAGFLIGWLSFFAVYAGTVATLAIGFAEGLAHFVPLGEAARTMTAVGITLATSAINYVGVRAGAWVTNVTSVIKIVALVSLALLGPLWSRAELVSPFTTLVDFSTVSLSAVGLALSPVLFSYLGWNAPVYVASEIRAPGRNIPAALFAGLAICTVTYLLLNVAYLLALPLEALRGEVRVGETAARAFFGPLGGSFTAALILVSIASCLNATILVGPRIAYAMALDGLLFGPLRQVHATFRTPSVAIAAQALTAVTLILVLQRFPSTLDYTTFAIVLATMVDTLALYALRRRQPARHRPYRAWGYPAVPALYLFANAGIAAAMLRGRPAECGIALLVVASGLPCYAVFARRARRDG